MLIHPWDAARDDAEWLAFLRQQEFGQLIAAGRNRDVPIVVPTQFLVEPSGPAGDAATTVILHLARPNPIWTALRENPVVLLSVAGDWSYIPSSWKAVGGEDPSLGIPTTYYAAVQLRCAATIVTDDAGKLEILRRQLARLEPDGSWADPAVHHRVLAGILGVRLEVVEVAAKFKYGGNADVPHRLAIADRLAERSGPGDSAARDHLLRRLAAVPE